MKISAYIHASRCGLPCGGVGRHANSMLLELASRPELDVEILTSASDLESDGRLPGNQPLRDMPVASHPFPERLIEPIWKLTGFPKIDRWAEGSDWVYSPMDARLPSRRVPVAVTIHDAQTFETHLPWSFSKPEVKLRRSMGLWLPKVLQEADRILTVSEFSRQRLVELLGADPEKVCDVGNGVDDIFFQVGCKLIEPDLECPVITIIGGLRYRKNADAMLKVARCLKEKGSPFRIKVVGANEARFVSEAESLGNVDLLGRLGDEAMSEVLSKSVASLFLSEYEGFGIPALESMACGVPAVCANRASLPEVCGNAGILVEPDAHHAIVETLEDLWKNPRARQDLSQAGKRHAATYTWKACADRLLAALPGKK